jgi:hypothetical protein
VLATAACPGNPDGELPSPSPTPTPAPYEVTVWVTLDGAAVAGASVQQGGSGNRVFSDEDGRAVVLIDPRVEGEKAIVAAHPEARTQAAPARIPGAEITIAMDRFDPNDNALYVFNEPGRFDVVDESTECTHCHKQLNEDWIGSTHASSASNPQLHDLYAGAAAAFDDPVRCAEAGGVWGPGPEPGGGGTVVDRCFIGRGVLEALNTSCMPGIDCSSPPTRFGACADCHAPAIDGQLGGRDLHEAVGISFDSGIHCDLCHKVESVDLAAPAGVAGRLRVLRPSEPSISPSMGDWMPLSFGPYPDVPNAFMGAVERPHFRNGDLCAGCHELEQPVLVTGASIDLSRWPSGTLPIHSTHSEWLDAGVSACGGCHMPAHPDAINSADLGLVAELTPGIVPGWPRPAGSVRRHHYPGARDPHGELLSRAASLALDTDLQGSELTVSLSVTNLLAGHALPTGDPLRATIALVRARCAGIDQPAVGGDAVPDFGGYIARKEAGDDWSDWPQATAGMRLRVVRRSGGFHDYAGPGRFGDGSFDATQKGLPIEHVVGTRQVLTANGGAVTLDAPLPAGDIAYLVDAPRWPDGQASGTAWAGAAGFAFARVTVGPDGQRSVPHYLAVDIASDNRLPHSQSWTSEHHFDVQCPDPDVEAVLVHRRFASPEATLRGWTQDDRVMVRKAP